MIKIESNFKDVLKGLNYFEKKQLPYIHMLTTNNLAFDFLDTMKLEIDGKLNIHKKQIPSSTRVKKATKSKPYAEIYVDEWSWQHKVLEHHFKGGDRERRGMEKALKRLGYISGNEILTPSPGVKIKSITYVQMMSQLKLDYKAGYNSNETTKSRLKNRASKTNLRFFMITSKTKSHLAPGVYARSPLMDNPIIMLRISSKPNYKKQFDMAKTLEIVYQRRGFEHFNNAYLRAMRTAR